MTRSRYIPIFCLLAALICCGIDSCVYDFQPVVPEEEYMLVIDGDILVGGTTIVRVENTRPLGQSTLMEGYAGMYAAWDCTVTVEGEDGTVVKGDLFSGGRFELDTRNLRTDVRYRMRLKSASQGEWLTPWLEVYVTPGISDLRAEYDMESPTHSMSLLLTTGESSGDIRYRWSYREDWQYQSTYLMTATADLSQMRVEKHQVRNHYCWSHDESAEILLGDPQRSDDGILHDFPLLRRYDYDTRISDIYSCEVTQTAIGPEAYTYYRTILENSDNVGTFFSPQPSEIHGNIISVEDSTKRAIGYISATVPVTGRIYLKNSETDFYSPNAFSRCPVSIVSDNSRANWYAMRNHGYIMYDVEPMTGNTYWSEKRCVDCTAMGGTTSKPAWWPFNPEEY